MLRMRSDRSDHRSVAKRGFESAIPEVLRDAFEMEQSLGTSPHEAAFYIIEGLKPQWRTRIDFDGHPELDGIFLY